MPSFYVQPDEPVQAEIDAQRVPVEALLSEAVKYLNDPDVDDVALARMFIERGHSEELSYWLVREAEVRHAP